MKNIWSADGPFVRLIWRGCKSTPARRQYWTVSYGADAYEAWTPEAAEWLRDRLQSTEPEEAPPLPEGLVDTLLSQNKRFKTALLAASDDLDRLSKLGAGVRPGNSVGNEIALTAKLRIEATLGEDQPAPRSDPMDEIRGRLPFHLERRVHGWYQAVTTIAGGAQNDCDAYHIAKNALAK